MINNPFVLTPHVPEALFCDREQETQTVIDYVNNGGNVTIISPRRLGKTGLIYHVFDRIKSCGMPFDCYYVDLYSSQSYEDFICLLTESVVNVLKRETMIKRFLNKLGSIRPVITYDVVHDKLSASMTFQNDQERSLTLKNILGYLNAQSVPVLIAIDEFQQVREYEGVSMEAILRTYIQPLDNVRFIFSGSKKHMMTEMFTSPRSPFYDSTHCLYLDKIPHDVYHQYIVEMFAKYNKSITTEAVDFILDWTKRHTLYTQTLCNVVFLLSRGKIDVEQVYEAIRKILQEREPGFIESGKLLTKGQWNYLRAIAKEGELKQPTATEFLKKHSIGTPATSMRALHALVDKELVLETTTLDGTSYSVYNVFLSRWLESI